MEWQTLYVERHEVDVAMSRLALDAATKHRAALHAVAYHCPQSHITQGVRKPLVLLQSPQHGSGITAAR